MKKLFKKLLLAVGLLTIGATSAMAQADYNYATDLATVTTVEGGTQYSWGFLGEKLKGKQTWIEVPSSVCEGTVTFVCAGSNTGRFLYILGQNGTVQDDSRKMAYIGSNKEVSCEFTSLDIMTSEGKYYLVFTTTDDFKIKGNVTLFVKDMTPVISSFEIGGVSATIDQTAKTIVAEVPYSTEGWPTLAPVVSLGGTATSYTPTDAQDFSAPVVYTVTDGVVTPTEYTVTITRAEANGDATLKDLKVGETTIEGFDPAVLEYNVVLPFAATLESAKVSATTDRKSVV